LGLRPFRGLSLIWAEPGLPPNGYESLRLGLPNKAIFHFSRRCLPLLFALPLGNDLLSAFFASFTFNLAVGGGFTVAANLLSLKSIPLGYSYPLVQTSLYGIFLGTDSFGVNHGSRFPPSITVVYSPGFYELTGFILLAAATARLTLFSQTGWVDDGLTRVKKRSEIRLSRYEILVVILAILFRMTAAAKESINILASIS
jgi:hypothetical protein